MQLIIVIIGYRALFAAYHCGRLTAQNRCRVYPGENDAPDGVLCLQNHKNHQIIVSE